MRPDSGAYLQIASPIATVGIAEPRIDSFTASAAYGARQVGQDPANGPGHRSRHRGAPGPRDGLRAPTLRGSAVGHRPRRWMTSRCVMGSIGKNARRAAAMRGIWSMTGGPRSVQSWPIWAAHNPTANVSPLRVDGLVQVAANRSGMSRGFELSGSLVRDVWADDGLWLVRARLGHGIPGSSGRTW